MIACFTIAVKHCMHHVPGRMRIRSEAVKGNEPRALEAERLLRAVAGVRSVRANTVTGSIVIEYQPGLADLAALAQMLHERGFFAERLRSP